MATTWTPIASVVQTTIPNDITGNSLSLAPVSGDATAVGLSLGNGSSTLFSVNASGNVSAAAASLGGNLTVSGATTLGATSVTSMTNSGQMTAKNAQVSGNGTAIAPAYSYTSQTDTGAYLASASTSAAVLGYAVNGTQALSMTKSGINVPGTLNVTGATTLGNATVGNLTTSGLTNTGSGTAAGLFSSILGTASAPSFSYTNQADTGLYLATQSATAAVLGLSVNGTQAVSLAKSGVSVPGTFGVTGATTLAGTSTGALSVSGNETVFGTLGVTGATTLGTLSAGASTVTSVATTSLGPVTSPPHTFVGQTDTGFYLPTQSSTAAIMGLAVNGTQSLALSKLGITVPGTLNVTGASTLSGNTTFGGTLSSTGNITANALFASATGSASAPVISNSNYTSTGIYFSSTPALVFTAAGTAVASMNASSMNVAQLLNAQASLAVAGTSSFAAAVGVTGTLTATNLTLASGGGGKFTFADGTTQTTAASSGTPGTSSTFTATGNGTTSLPAYTYTANTDTGAYLKTASATAAVLGLAVNATDAMTLSKIGVTIPGTLSTGGALTSGGLVTAPNVTLGSGGKITFGDGSTLTSAASSAATSFTASINGTVSAPVFTFANNTDTGAYLSTQSSTAAVMSMAVNATNALNVSKTGVSVPGTLAVTGVQTNNAAVNVNGTVTATNFTLTNGGGGKLTFADGTTQTTAGSGGSAATFTASAANGGSATAPVFLSTLSSSTGMYFDNSPSISFTVSGTRQASVTASGLQVPGNATVSGTTNLNGTVTFGAAPNFGSSAITTAGAVSGVTIAANYASGTASAPVITFGTNSSSSGFYYPNTTTGVACTSAGTLAWNASSSLMTLALPTTTAKTFTSTTAAGTASFVSSQGFQNRLDMGHVYTTSTTTTAQVTQRCVVLASGGSYTASQVFQVQDRAGSVTGISVNNSGAITTTTMVQLYKNGSAVSGATATIASNSQFSTATFAKGTYAFAANDYLQAYVTYGATGQSLATSVTLTVELGA